MTESMSSERQYNNINIKIDRFFNYIINKEDENPEKFTINQEIEFLELIEKLELNYTKEFLEILSEENITKLKTIIYALKELYFSNKQNLLTKVTRDKLIQLYEKCKSKEIEYRETSKEIKNFFEYYYSSLIRDLEKAR